MGRTGFRRRAWICGLAGALVCCLAIAPAAHATVYWADAGNDNIGSVSNLMTGANTAFKAIGAGTDPCGVTVDEPGDILLTGITQNNLGTSIDQVTISSGSLFAPVTAAGTAPCDLAHDASHTYWSNSLDSIGRADYPPTQASTNTTFITGLTGGVCGLAVDGSHIYFGVDTKIERAALDGTVTDPNFITGLGAVCGVAVNATHVYWADQTSGKIGSADLDGSNPNGSFFDTGATGGLCGLTANNDALYWADRDANRIGGATTAATALGTVTAGGEPCGVTVPTPPTCDAQSLSTQFGKSLQIQLGECNQPIDGDWAILTNPAHGEATGFDSTGGTLTYKPAKGFSGTDTLVYRGRSIYSGVSNHAVVTILVKPSNRFTIGRPKPNTHNGSARLSVKVPGKGKLVLSGKGVKAAKATAKKKGTVKFTVKATGKARSSLAQHGRASVKAKVTFTPTGGDPSSKRRSVKLVKS